MSGRIATGLIRRDMVFGGAGRLTGDVVRARVDGDPAGSGDLFLASKIVYLMALPEKIIVQAKQTDASGAVVFDWLLQGREYAAYTLAAKLPDDSYVIGDYWDRLFPGAMP